jgi:adenylyltransferase/sulfurtransferase
VIGSLQALEALKIVLGAGKTLAGRLVLFDALETEFRQLRVRRDPECPACGDAPTIRELIDYEAFCGVAAVDAGDHLEVGALDLAREREANPRLLLLDVREPVEWQICRIAGSELVPLRELPATIPRLERDRDVVAICHLGTRSLTAARMLRAAGFRSARSLKGGVAAWADEVDPLMSRY